MNKKYYGLNGLDERLEPYIDFDGGYFIELGANDGLTQSNTAYFEKSRGWKGVLIEPILHNYLKCVKNRSEQNRFFCNACVSFEYEKPYVELSYANLMTAASGLESDIKDGRKHAEGGARHLKNGEIVVDIMAPAKTLHSILDSAEAPKDVDLLSLDVEGAELEVLKGVNLNYYKIKSILIETRSKKSIGDHLSQFGYRLVAELSFHDYLFVRE